MPHAWDTTEVRTMAMSASGGRDEGARADARPTRVPLAMCTPANAAGFPSFAHVM
jgi:hypothetical protein